MATRAHPRTLSASDDPQEVASAETNTAVPPPTIREVLAALAAYLTTHYLDSVTDQEAVLDAARMADDGHIIGAWRHLARMLDGVLNVPPGEGKG